jgi:hypothetical protein
MVGVQRGTPPGLEERPDRAHRCGELVVSLTVGHGRVHGGAHETEEHPRVVVLSAPLGPKNADTPGSDLGAEVSTAVIGPYRFVSPSKASVTAGRD